MKKKCLKSIVLILTVVFLLSGCTSEKIGIHLGKFESANDSFECSGTVAENDRYLLGFDESNKGVYLKDKKTSVVFSSNPKITDNLSDDFFVHPQLRSDIAVDYVDEDGKTLLTSYSFLSCVSSGNLTCEKIENGIKITYYFNEEEFSVPVNYVLSNDCLSVFVVPSEIKEKKRKVLSVSVNPFMCSCKNDSDNSYVFIPSGSGAIAYPDTVSEVGNSYSQYLYGEDPTIEKWTQATDEQNIKLPVFGTKRGNTAICGIISEGTTNCKIDALVGGSQYLYSTVYATFDVRARTPVQVSMYGYKKKTVVYSDGVIDRKCQVDFYPLFDEEASYSGMAHLFREKTGIKENKSKSDNLQINLVIYGGCVSKKSFFGIPYDSVYSATTLKDAEKIIDEVSKKTSADISVLLKGFGSTGINIGSVAGDYTVNGNLGSVSELKKLSKKYKSKNIDIYFDFDVVRQSDNSFISFKDTAKSLNNQTVFQYDYGVALKDRLEDSRYSLLSRKTLSGIGETLIKKTKKLELFGVGFESLSNICYSDNSSNEYMLRTNMENDVQGIFDLVKKSGKSIASVGANYYAAKCSDIIFETPCNSNENDVFSADVPFYQMVFKGSSSITSSPINQSGDENEALLKAIESGAGITYGVYKNFDAAITDSKYPVFATGTYNDIKDDIFSVSKAVESYYEKINNATVLKHSILDGDLRLTEFSNGVKVYVNYSSEDKTADGTLIKANSWVVK